MVVCVCSLSFPPLLGRRWWPNDFPRKLSIQKTEAAINLLLVALLLLVLLQPVLCPAMKSHGHTWKPQRHAFFGVGPFILNWFSVVDLPKLSSDRAATDGCLRSIAIRYYDLTFSSFPSFSFRKCAVCDFPSETSATPYPRFQMRYI